MEDDTTKKTIAVESERPNEQLKKMRFTHFEEVNSKINISKENLLGQISEFVAASRRENTEIRSLLDANIKSYQEKFYEFEEIPEDLRDGMDEGSADEEESLSDYPEKIKYFMAFTEILKRVKPLCTSIEVEVLVPIRKVLEEIRLLCGCDLDHVSSWDAARPHTDELSIIATELDISKSQLSNKNQYIFKEMEFFIFIYQQATQQDKENFKAQLNENAESASWLRPWIDKAEGNNVSFEEALILSMESTAGQIQAGPNL